MVRITVKFDGLHYKFVYELEEIPKNQVCDIVQRTLSENMAKHREIRRRDSTAKHEPTQWYMKLSKSELQKFGEL